MGCSPPGGREELDTTERLHFHFALSCIGEGNGNPLQCSCLENPRDGGAWWAAVYGVTQSRTRLKRLSSSSSSQGEPRQRNRSLHLVVFVRDFSLFLNTFKLCSQCRVEPSLITFHKSSVLQCAPASGIRAHGVWLAAVYKPASSGSVKTSGLHRAGSSRP